MNSYFEKLPFEIKEEIFQYLCVEDLLNFAIVSKNINESIGKSRRCMKKIWIKFYSFKLKDLDSLDASVRNYEKLKVNRVKRDDHFKYLMELGQNWKKVLIYNCEFSSFSNYVNFITSISNSVEELEISDIEILSNDLIKNSSIKFPSLKRFMFRNMPSNTLETFLSSSKLLENAAFDIAQEFRGSLSLYEIICNILKNSQKLKHLQLGPSYIKALFEEENKCLEVPFNLKKLLLKFPIANDLSDLSHENISNFIRKQQNIEWLVTMELKNEKILSAVWNEVDSLTRISFVGLEELFDIDMELNIEPNFKITHLDMISRKILLSQLGKLLGNAPMVSHLHVRNLNKHMMNFLLKNHQNVKYLLYEYVDEDAVEIYKEFQILNDGDVSKHIELKQQSFWFNDNPFSIDPIFWRKE